MKAKLNIEEFKPVAIYEFIFSFNLCNADCLKLVIKLVTKLVYKLVSWLVS